MSLYQSMLGRLYLSGSCETLVSPAGGIALSMPPAPGETGGRLPAPTGGAEGGVPGSAGGGIGGTLGGAGGVTVTPPPAPSAGERAAGGAEAGGAGSPGD